MAATQDNHTVRMELDMLTLEGAEFSASPVSSPPVHPVRISRQEWEAFGRPATLFVTLSLGPVPTGGHS